MSTTTTPTNRLLTAEEFYDFCQRPENRDRHFELERGEVVEMPPPGCKHGVACINVGTLLRLYVKQRSRGFVCGNDAGIIWETDPDTVRGPDLSVFAETIRFDDLPDGFARLIPVLVVEVRSPHDRHAKLLRRIEKFLRAGVAVVWLVDPLERTVTVFRRDQFPQVLEDTESLSGAGELPGFQCRVAELFAADGGT